MSASDLVSLGVIGFSADAYSGGILSSGLDMLPIVLLLSRVLLVVGPGVKVCKQDSES